MKNITLTTWTPEEKITHLNYGNQEIMHGNQELTYENYLSSEKNKIVSVTKSVGIVINKDDFFTTILSNKDEIFIINNEDILSKETCVKVEKDIFKQSFSTLVFNTQNKIKSTCGEDYNGRASVSGTGGALA